MKINQILKENTLNPDYIPNDYILSQLRVSTIREFNNIQDQYQFPHLQDLDKYEIGPYQQVFKFNTTPDWDRSAYYDHGNDKDRLLLLVYPTADDHAQFLVSSTFWKDPYTEEESVSKTYHIHCSDNVLWHKLRYAVMQQYNI